MLVCGGPCLGSAVKRLPVRWWAIPAPTGSLAPKSTLLQRERGFALDGGTLAAANGVGFSLEFASRARAFYCLNEPISYFRAILRIVAKAVKGRKALATC